MLLSPTAVTTLILLISYRVSAVPQPNVPAGLTMSLTRRSPLHRTEEEWGIWAKSHREGLEAKYGNTKHKRRGTGTNLITNQNADSSYFGSLALGTPPTSFSLILDTGSADLWVAGVNCNSQSCQSTPTFDPSTSSSFKNETTRFEITYGSGEAAGNLASDVIQMAGFSVSNQVFAVCDTVSDNLLTTPVSGLLGLAFQTIASSKAMPFWETLVTNGAWDSPVMAFYLTRYVNVSSSQAEQPGGEFAMGFVNTTLYTGDIDYVAMPTGRGSYWILEMASMTVNGNSISLASGSASYAAIDTGTTLIGGPSEYISQIYAQIPGSTPGTGDLANYYTYPCDTTVSVAISFGNKSWSISPADFRIATLSNRQCLGAFFALTTGTSAPPWIIGDTFLKNVYSVFRYSPLSIGFAELSSTAIAQNGVRGSAPTPTIGSVSTVYSTSAAKSGSVSRSYGHPMTRVSTAVPIFVLSVLSLFTRLLP